MEQDVKKQSLTGFVWKFLEKGGVQIMSMVVQIVLARLLLPEDYGIIGYLTIFTTLSDVFLKQGFSTALIQKKDSDDLDFCTVFFANVAMSIVIYAIFYFIAPWVSVFYNEVTLTPIMRVLCLSIIIGSLSSVHEAQMSKQLAFKKSFVRGLANTLSYGISGIVLAYLGFGVWSLVWGRLIGLSVGVIVYWITIKWRPRLQFSFSRLKSLFSFSSRVLLTNILNTVYNNINSLIIGKFYTSSDLGYYQRGQNIPQTVMTSVDGSMSEVMYPTFSKLQDSLEKVKSALRRSMKLSMYVCLPILAGLCATAESLTSVLLTEKWLPSVPYMQLTCILCAFWPLSARTHALNAIGKSKVTLRISLIGKIISLVFILILIRYGVIYIMVGSIFSSLINFFIVSIIVNKYISYSILELLKDILSAIIMAIIMGIIVWSITKLGLNPFITLLIQVPVGVAIYVGLSAFFKVDSFIYILKMVKDFIASRKENA